MPNGYRRPSGLLPLLPGTPARYAPPRPTFDISRTAPRAPGRQQTPNSPYKDFERSRRAHRDPDFDYQDPPIALGYVDAERRQRLRLHPEALPTADFTWRDGIQYYDPERRLGPAADQAEGMRRQFARTVGQPGVNAGRQARVADAIRDPRVLALLDTLSMAEGEAWRGVPGGLPWNALLNSYPRRPLTFKMNNPPRGDHVATGRYQVQGVTYRDIAPSLGITDFHPRSQNAVVLGILDRYDAMLKNLRAANLRQFANDASVYWASLPRGPLAGQDRDKGRYNQRAITYDDFLAYWKKMLIKHEGGDPRGLVVEEPVAYRP